MTRADGKTDFSAAGQSGAAAQFINYLDTASALQWFRYVKRRTFELLRPQPGADLLDVGCGTGDDARLLADMVGSDGRVVGVDHSAAMIEEARQRAQGLDLPVEYMIGDVQRLDFADNTFDGVRAERLLVHLERPHEALAELVRVARPGGRIVVMDGDWETLILDSIDRRLTRTVLNSLCDTLRNGWVGRQLASIFREFELQEIAVYPETLLLTDYNLTEQLLGLRATVERAATEGLISGEEGERWLQDLEQRGRTGRFFGAVTAFTVCGCKAS